MRYFNEIENGYIIAIGTGPGGVEIASEEYAYILDVIRSAPIAETGYDYILKEDLTWELVEAPVVDTSNEEISAEEALDIILGGVTA